MKRCRVKQQENKLEAVVACLACELCTGVDVHCKYLVSVRTYSALCDPMIRCSRLKTVQNLAARMERQVVSESDSSHNRRESVHSKSGRVYAPGKRESVQRV